MMLNRAFAAFVLVLSIGCSHPSLQELADDHAKQTGLQYANCGTVQVAQKQPCDETTVDDCLLAALSTCAPSRAALSQSTIEGAPIPSEVFIEPEGASCVVTEIVDTTRDNFGPKTVKRYRCDGFVAIQCFTAVPTGCVLAETYYTK